MQDNSNQLARTSNGKKRSGGSGADIPHKQVKIDDNDKVIENIGKAIKLSMEQETILLKTLEIATTLSHEQPNSTEALKMIYDMFNNIMTTLSKAQLQMLFEPIKDSVYPLQKISKQPVQEYFSSCKKTADSIIKCVQPSNASNDTQKLFLKLYTILNEIKYILCDIVLKTKYGTYEVKMQSIKKTICGIMLQLASTQSAAQASNIIPPYTGLQTIQGLEKHY